MKKLSKITESFWGDVHKRSRGDGIRKEDDIELLDRDEMYDYIFSHYDYSKVPQAIPAKSTMHNSDTLYYLLPLFIYGTSIYRFAAYYENGKIVKVLLFANKAECEGFYDKITQRFKVYLQDNGVRILKEKDDTVSNQLVLDLIDIVAEYAKKPMFHKKVTESFWGDVHKRSRGDEIRKEDDFNLLDLNGFCEYLKKNYKSLVNRDVISITSTGWLCVYLYGSPSGFPLFYKDSVINVQPYVMFDLNCSKEIQQKYNIDCTSEYMEISPKDGSPVDNKFFIEVLDYFLEILDRPEVKKDHNKMIEKIKGVKESFWGDVHKRSRGDEIRKEDDINNLDREEFYDYLTSHYKPTPSYHFAEITTSSRFNSISVPIIYRFGLYNINFDFNPKKVSIWIDALQSIEGLLKKMEENFSLKESVEFDKVHKIISPKDGSEVTNAFFIDVIDFITDNIAPNERPMKKIVNESFWGDVHKRSRGDEIRKEDDIDLLDIHSLCDYLHKIYKCTDDIDIDYEDGYINAVLYEDQYGYIRYLFYDGTTVTTQYDVIKNIDCVSEIKDKYTTSVFKNEFDILSISIYPKDRARVPVTNKFFIEVLDYILSKIEPPLTKQIEKREN